MSKLVLLNEVKREEKEININLKNDTNEDLTNRYFEFEDKIFNNKLNLKAAENKLSSLIEKIFSLNKNLFINFLNSIYSDYLSNESNIEICIDKKNFNNCLLSKANSIFNILVEDEYRKYKYTIEITCEDYDNIAILILKDDLGRTRSNIVNFKKKKHEYESLVDEKEELNNSDECLLILNSNIDIPDRYKINNNNRETSNNLKIIKLWKYDFKKIFDEKLFLLLPVKVLDLKNMIDSLKNIDNSERIIEKEIQRFNLTLDRYVQKLCESNIINDNDINEIKSISNGMLSIVY